MPALTLQAANLEARAATLQAQLNEVRRQQEALSTQRAGLRAQYASVLDQVRTPKVHVILCATLVVSRSDTCGGRHGSRLEPAVQFCRRWRETCANVLAQSRPSHSMDP